MPAIPLGQPPADAIINSAYIIQLAVAPVFLLTGVGAMISVLTNRLGRIIDRARVMQHRYADPSLVVRERQDIHAELALLSQRARMVNWAIGLCTSCSLLVSLSIMTLFLEALAHRHFIGVVPLLFILAMSAFICGLLCFLREIMVATAGLRLGPPEN